MSSFVRTLSFFACIFSMTAPGSAHAQTLSSPPRSTSWRFPTNQSFGDGTLVDLVHQDSQLELAGEHTEGSFTSPLIPLGRSYDRVVPSWNVRTPDGSSVEIAARVHRAGQPVSGWLRVVTWSRKTRGARDTSSGSATLDQETLKITGGADAVELRATLRQGTATDTPTLSALGLTAFASTQAPSSAVSSTGGQTLKIPVPYRSQRTAPAPIAMRVCGPTSLSMILEYHGIDLTIEAVAALARDPTGAVQYGNWSYLAATAAELGMDTEVRAMATLDEVVQELQKGNPVIMGIAFERGELPGSPIPDTAGHLILARGFDKDGNIHVNDPAGHRPQNGQIRYGRAELARAWKRGIAIIVKKPPTFVALDPSSIDEHLGDLDMEPGEPTAFEREAYDPVGFELDFGD